MSVQSEILFQLWKISLNEGDTIWLSLREKQVKTSERTQLSISCKYIHTHTHTHTHTNIYSFFYKHAKNVIQ